MVLSILLAIALLGASSAPAAPALERGMLLVASPANRHPGFRETVILIGDVKPGKIASGVILNRPTGRTLAELVPALQPLGAAKHEVYVGGSTEPDRLILLYRARETAEEKTAKVLDDVVIAWGHETLERLLREGASPNDVRLYAGYAMWIGDKLQNEIARGDWRLLPAQSAHVFRDPETLWEDLDRTDAKLRSPELEGSKRSPRRIGGLLRERATGVEPATSSLGIPLGRGRKRPTDAGLRGISWISSSPGLTLSTVDFSDFRWPSDTRTDTTVAASEHPLQLSSARRARGLSALSLGGASSQR